MSSIGRAELDDRLAGHDRWLATTGEQGSRLELLDADLSGADLRNRRLNEAVLSGSDLSGARLAGADLSGAVLPAANLSGADLSGARLVKADLDRVSAVR